LMSCMAGLVAESAPLYSFQRIWGRFRGAAPALSAAAPGRGFRPYSAGFGAAPVAFAAASRAAFFST